MPRHVNKSPDALYRDRELGKLNEYNRVVNEVQRSREQSGIGNGSNRVFNDTDQPDAQRQLFSNLTDKGESDSWPDHMKEHFDLQDNVNQFMEQRLNSVFEEDI